MSIMYFLISVNSENILIAFYVILVGLSIPILLLVTEKIIDFINRRIK